MLLHIANKELQVNRMKRLRSIFIVLIATFVLVAILSFGCGALMGLLDNYGKTIPKNLWECGLAAVVFGELTSGVPIAVVLGVVTWIRSGRSNFR